MNDLQTVRAAFRAAGLADGGIESFDDVRPELLWQIAEIREKSTHTEAEVQELLAEASKYKIDLIDDTEAEVRRILGVPAP